MCRGIPLAMMETKSPLTTERDLHHHVGQQLVFEPPGRRQQVERCVSFVLNV